MKRIIGTILAAGLSALTLAAAPAHAEERAGRDGMQQEYDRRPPTPERVYRHDRYARERSDENGYRDDRYRRDDEYGRAVQQREERYRHATVGIGTRDVDVRIDVGRWLAHR